MIRRNLPTESGKTDWLLVSQVEHARLSGELTEKWHQPFSAEVVAAITHHDDGWRTWEAAPQIDPDRGCPLSFLEMSMDRAIQIWNRSIRAARRVGPLAAAIVAGHFMGLASGSEHARQDVAERWIARMTRLRSAWLEKWHAASSANTMDAADRGQRMLLTADLLSLWLCCDGPVTSVDAGEVPNAEMKTRTADVLGSYCFTAHSNEIECHQVAWQGSLTPWPFAVGEFNLATPAIAAPTKIYRSWSELLQSSRPIQLRWRLSQTLPTGGKC